MSGFPGLLEEQTAALDRVVSSLIEDCRGKAAAILTENRAVPESRRDTLLAKKTIDAKTLGELLPAPASGAASAPRGPVKQIESAP